jgi:hypothetical protein
MTFPEFIDFRLEHLDQFEPAERNGRAKQKQFGPLVAAHSSAFTAIDSDGVLGCGGLVPIYPHRALAWTSVSHRASAPFFVRFLIDYLDRQAIKRIETTVDTDDRLCHKWVRLLGFEPEGPPMKFFNADGSSAQMYVRYRDGP